MSVKNKALSKKDKMKIAEKQMAVVMGCDL
jgi:hypothetical protein